MKLPKFVIVSVSTSVKEIKRLTPSVVKCG